MKISKESWMRLRGYSQEMLDKIGVTVEPCPCNFEHCYGWYIKGKDWCGAKPQEPVKRTPPFDWITMFLITGLTAYFLWLGYIFLKMALHIAGKV